MQWDNFESYLNRCRRPRRAQSRKGLAFLIDAEQTVKLRFITLDL